MTEDPEAIAANGYYREDHPSANIYRPYSRKMIWLCGRNDYDKDNSRKRPSSLEYTHCVRDRIV